MKKSVKVILVSALLLIGIISASVFATANEYPFDNLFEKGFQGYTSDEGEIPTTEYVSSKHIAVAEGETVWFGPCDPAQYFQLVGLDANGNAATDKIRGKQLEETDGFNNDMVIYKYVVPAGVAKLCFSAPGSVAEVYTVAKTEITALNWDAYWDLKGVNTDDFVGQSSYYEVKAGDKIYFGAITEEDALATATYNKSAANIGTINKDDLRLVESFGGKYGIYCYTVNDSNVKYVNVPYDIKYEQYYTSIQLASNDKTTDAEIVEKFITTYGIQRPLASTVKALEGQSALFLGDSITFGARDRANIYGVKNLNAGAGGGAARIGYFCNMDVTNNGVSGACITTSRRVSSSEKHYIYNNLVAAKDAKFDYVIMHGLFNDASDKVTVGVPQGKANFDPSKAAEMNYAQQLELLFYTARQQHPEATLGFIVNFHTDRAVDQTLYAKVAIQICEDWGVQYLDLYNDKTFSVEFDDGLHPSSAGYDSMYTRVANWMAGLKKGGASTDTKTSTAKVMSYNVFWSPADAIPDKGITISNRVNKIKNVIADVDADIFMTQETSTGSGGWVPRLVDFANANGYGYYGYAHGAEKGIDSVAGINTTTSGGGEGEMTPIFWKTNKYDLVDKGHFQASSTPDVAGSIWTGVESEHENGKIYPRCVNWVILKDKTTGEQILVVNYHADPATTVIRNLSAQLIMNKISEISAKYDNLAVVFGGDMNMQRSHVAYTTIAGNGLGDAQKEAATDKVNGQGSYNSWNRVPAKFGYGDYLFVNKDVIVDTYDVYNDVDPDQAGIYITDHSPIIAEIKY